MSTAAIIEAWKPLFEQMQEATGEDYLSIELTATLQAGTFRVDAKVYVPGPISWTPSFPTVDEAVNSILKPDRFALEARLQKVNTELAKLQEQAKEIDSKLAEVLEKELATEGAVK